MVIGIFIVLSVFTILTFYVSLLLTARQKQKEVLDLTLRESFFQKRTLWMAILLLIIPSPILFGYYSWKLYRSVAQPG